MSSSKRARWDGSEAVRILWPPGETNPNDCQEWIVEPGHWLPDDAPAALRDELTANDERWVEINQPGKGEKDGE